MMKGTRNGISLDKITDKLLDRTEFEIERYCLAIGVRFDDLAAAYTHAAAQRFGAVLHGSQQWSVRGQMQSVRVEAAAIHQVELPALEGARHPQDSGAAPEATGKVQGHRRQAVNMETMEISLRRPGKRKDAVGRAMYKGLRKKLRAIESEAAVGKALKGRKPPSKPGPGGNRRKPEKIAKQKIYAARARARRLGLPQPPLPKREAA